MRSPLSASLIFLGFTSSRFNLAHSFSTTVARMQDGKSTSCIGTATTTSLRAKTKNDDAGRNSNKNNKSDRKSTVAIIGGGIAGLSCARHLQHSYDVTVVSRIFLGVANYSFCFCFSHLNDLDTS